MRSLIAWAGGPAAAPLLQSVLDYNDEVRCAGDVSAR
jgi:hypothetical protein